MQQPLTDHADNCAPGEVRARLLTAAAPAAIAVLELAGPPAAVRATLAPYLTRLVLDRLFVVDQERRAPLRATWRRADGVPLDDLLVVERAPRHGEDRGGRVELHVHGGAGVVAGVLADLAAAGARVSHGGAGEEGARWPAEVSWQPGLRGVYERALARAPTSRVANIVLAQLVRVPQWLSAVRRGLEEGERGSLGQLLSEAIDGLAWRRYVEPGLIASGAALRLRSREGGAAGWPEAVLMGQANAGKSSLFNALVQEARVIVSPHAGTTRDAVDAVVAVSGMPVRIWDTAGLALAPGAPERLIATGDARGLITWSADALDRRGQVASARVARRADLIVWVVPASLARNDPLAGARRVGAAGAKAVWRPFGARGPGVAVVETKIDQLAGAGGAARASPTGRVRTSAATGEGVADLRRAIGEWLRVPRETARIPVLPMADLAIQLQEITAAREPGRHLEVTDELLARLRTAFRSLIW